MAEVKELIEVCGTVSTLYYAKGGFSAGEMYNGAKKIKFSVKGLVKHGQPLTLKGNWETHPKYGRQFVGQQIVYTLPSTAEGIESWLLTYAPGFGSVKAKRGVEAFGTDLMKTMKDDPEAVAIELGLPIEFVNRTADCWVKNSSEVNCMGALLAAGLTQKEAEAVYGRYQGNSVMIVDEDPYQMLGEVEGMGWKRIDAMGKRIGLEGTDKRRVDGACLEVVRGRYDEGHTAVRREAAIGLVQELVGDDVKVEMIEQGYERMIGLGKLVVVGRGLALPKCERIERGLWDWFDGLDRKNTVLNVREDEVRRYADGFMYRGVKVTLDESQIQALIRITQTMGCTITGGAGAGKTLLASAAVRLYEIGDQRVGLCAPTGKAARRLSSVVGREATTIHRMLGYDRITGGFEYRKGNSLPFDVVVVDEVSMCDSSLLGALAQAVGPNTAVVMIGDPNQLPPVGAGYPLRDVLELGLVPWIKLEQCHRQAGVLAKGCNQILAGELMGSDEDDVSQWILKDNLSTPEQVVECVKFVFEGRKEREGKLKELGWRGLFDHQFLTAQHKGLLGTERMNELLQRLHQKTLGYEMNERGVDERLPLLVGDKVIHTVNNYELGVMNGTIGRVVDDEPLVVEYEDGANWRQVIVPKGSKGEVSLAYCLTAHKMQGSQVPCVVTICHKLHGYMQHRNWLYTAVTRAQKVSVLLGDEFGVKRSVERVQVSDRVTVLQLLKESVDVAD